MKERVFYVINLDKQRMAVLGIFFVGLLFSFFFLGVSIGKGKSEFQKNEVATLSAPSLAGTEEPNESKASKAGSEVEIVPLSEGPSPSQSYYIESTDTNPNESSEKKTQIIDLTKPLPKQDLAMKNQSPVREIPLSKKEIPRKEIVSKREVSQPKPTNLEKKYTVQLASFGTREAALAFVKQVKLHGNSKVSVVSKNSLFAVHWGQSDSKDSLAKQLQKSSLPAEWKKNALVVSASAI